MYLRQRQHLGLLVARGVIFHLLHRYADSVPAALALVEPVHPPPRVQVGHTSIAALPLLTLNCWTGFSAMKLQDKLKRGISPEKQS